MNHSIVKQTSVLHTVISYFFDFSKSTLKDSVSVIYISYFLFNYLTSIAKGCKFKDNICISIYLSIYHHDVSLARISRTPSHYLSLSSIATGSSSRIHPVFVQSCCRSVLGGHLTFVRSYEGVHWTTSLISSSLLLQLCPTCSVRLVWMIFERGGWWPYSCCFVGCFRQDLFNTSHNILAQLPSSFFFLNA